MPRMHSPAPKSLLARAAALACAASLGFGCGDDDCGVAPAPGVDAGKPVSVEIGMRVGPRDNTFVPLEPGGDIRLGTFGQGGTHAELAVRCVGFGNRAFVALTLENLVDGTVIMHPPTSRPQLLRCVQEPEGACDLLPIYFMTGGLADPEDKDGLPVRVAASCTNEAGATAGAVIDGVLRADEEAAAVGRNPPRDEDGGVVSEDDAGL